VNQAVVPVVTEALSQALGELDQEGLQRLFIGFSGGLDSTVVLDAAMQLPCVRVVALHVNHHLHPDSDSWAARCADFCSARDIEFQSHDVEVPEQGSLEAAARAARYEVFERVLRKGDVLMLGHHVDDQSETVLFRLLRGSAAGLGGMAASRSLGRGLLLRPLLGLPRGTLKQYALERQLEWLDDPSNADLRHDRNYLRRVIMPRLVERWPHAVANIVRATRAQAADAKLLEDLLDQQVAQASVGARLDTAQLLAFTAPTRLLRHWIAGYGIHGAREAALQELVKQLERQTLEPNARSELRVADDVVVRGYAGRVYLVRVLGRPQDWCDLEWSLASGSPGSDLELPHGKLCAHRADGAGVRDGPFRVTLRRGGERLRPVAGGPSRTVKRLLADAAVPPWRRVDYPLLYCGALLVAVPGVAVAATAHCNTGGWKLSWEAADTIMRVS
jgi:tRNA(Ile)-lysidine synthase